jgi:hypothetical protein
VTILSQTGKDAERTHFGFALSFNNIKKIHFRGANSIRRMDRIHAPLEKCRIEILN